MANAPTISSISPAAGSTIEESYVVLRGTGFAQAFPPVASGPNPEPFPSSVRVWFGTVASSRVLVLSPTEVRCVVRPQGAGAVDVRLENLLWSGDVAPGEVVSRGAAFSFVRPGAGNRGIAGEGMLARVVRHLVRYLRSRLLDNVVHVTHTEYDDTAGDGLNIAAIAALPAIVLMGPRLTPSPAYEQPGVQTVSDGAGGVYVTPAPTARDMRFSLVIVTQHTQQMLDLTENLTLLIRRFPWLYIPRDGAAPKGDAIRYPMFLPADGGPLVYAGANSSNLRSSTTPLVVRGVQLEHQAIVDQTAPVQGDFAAPGQVPEDAAAAAELSYVQIPPTPEESTP